MPTTDTAPPPWPTAFRALVERRRPLLLQGPMGWFFHELASLLTAEGGQVTKVHFNGGDECFWRHPGALRYTDRLEHLADWLRTLMRRERHDAVVLFGQMRPIHCIARAVASELGVMVFVCEEGYLRPHYITIERRGVNALSRLPRAASFYAEGPLPRTGTPLPTGQDIRQTARIAARYGLAALALRPLYPHQCHHRSLHPVTEPLRWARSYARHLVYGLRERGLLERLTGPDLRKRWFLVPLQVQSDSQVTHHSRFANIEAFLGEVLGSFAAHAPAGTGLVVKHHPMDRAYTDYRRLLQTEAARLGIAHRVVYLHDQHLPTLLEHTLGVVTINSTVGLQALHHRAPVITLGASVYGIPGLVYGGTLAEFWRAPGTVDHALYLRFRQHLIAHTQLNASFYADMPALAQRPAHATPAEPPPREAADAPTPAVRRPVPPTDRLPPALAEPPVPRIPDVADA